MKHAQRYMIFFIIVAVVVAMLVLPQAVQPAMRTPKGTIVIDAGHGGFDGGATGKTTGVHEDGINLAVAKKLQDLFEKNGYEVIMTRETGEAVGDTKNSDMVRRAKIMLDAAPDVVISVHMNKFADASVSGPQVFFYEKSVEGEALAKLVQQSLIKTLEPNKERIEHSENYYILRKAPCPAIIVECGFLSNEREEKLLQDDAYQMKCAKAIYLGTNTYFEQRTQGEDTGDFHYPL